MEICPVTNLSKPECHCPSCINELIQKHSPPSRQPSPATFSEDAPSSRVAGTSMTPDQGCAQMNRPHRLGATGDIVGSMRSTYISSEVRLL